MKTTVTIADVARVANVSTSTVSHVVNGTRWVNPETAENVRAAIIATGYRPNTLARSLARRTSNAVGIAISTTVNPFFNEVAGAIEKSCAELGLMVFLADTQEDPERELEVIKALHGMQVSGIILAPSSSGYNAAVEYLKTFSVPSVLVDRQVENSPFDYVGSENVSSMAALLAHVARRGHKRIAMVSGQKDFSSSSERILGYRTGLQAADLTFDPDLLIESCTDLKSAKAAIGRLLSSNSRPTAIIGGNNLTTVASVAAAQALGLSIPRDLSLTGFDDFEWSDYFEPRLTLMAQLWEAIGWEAASLLVDRINGADDPPKLVYKPPVLIERGSVSQVYSSE